jgi:hypothetical protein
VLVVFAISATALLATIGLLYSFGLVLSQRRSLQTAADAASLAGAWQVLAELRSDDRLDANVRGAVERFAASNGVASSDVSGVYVDGTGASLSTTLGCGCAFPPEARGVRLTLNGRTSTALPGFVGAGQVLVQTTSSSTARPTAPPSSATLVIPVGVAAADYAAHGQIDLLSSRTRQLDLTSAGASTYPNNLQAWSDSQHANGTVNVGANVSLISTTSPESIAAGLADNVRRQTALHPSAAYAIVTVPLWDSATSGSVHVVGFAQLKIAASDITPTSVRGTFVPYPFDAAGVPVSGSSDYGASRVGLVS